MARTLLLLYWLTAIILFISPCVSGQRMFLNAGTGIVEQAGPGSNGFCNQKYLGHFCIVDSSNLYSIAFHNDTLYVITRAGSLYQIDLNNPGSCRFLTDFDMPGMEQPLMIGMVCDKNGMLYMVDDNSNVYYKYDPYINNYWSLGIGPSLDGDLIFYKDTLLCSTNGPFLYAVNLANPAASTPFMATGRYVFWGLMEAPGDCGRNKFYGVDNNNGQIVEFDPAARKIKGVVCESNYTLDGASTLEDGTIAGLAIDSLVLTPSCIGTGSVKVAASNGAGDSTTYTLDGSTTNNTGIFSNVLNGTHTIHIQSSSCIKDSIFSLQPEKPVITVQTTDPASCSNPSGSIAITPADPNYRFLYSLDNSTLQSQPLFYFLNGGLHTLSIIYGNGCKKDTGIILSYQHPTPLPGSITVNPAICNQENGSIVISPLGGNSSSIVSLALNNGPSQSSLAFTGLSSGIDTLHLKSNNGCHYDSILNVPLILKPEPSIVTTVANQVCFSDNGSLSLIVSGVDGPYLTNLNGGSFAPIFQYNRLAPATYRVGIADKDACTWDTAIVIQAYSKDPVAISLDTVNPSCTRLNSGSLTVSVTGDQAPYSIGYAGTNYPSGSLIGNLSYGAYTLPVSNMDGCLVDSVHVVLTLDISAECKVMSIPNAFSPNGDGHNDVFRVIHSPYQTGVQLRVYNRSGEAVFSSSDSREEWDGTYGGRPQPAGIYVWTLNYLDFDKQVKRLKGTVMLVR